MEREIISIKVIENKHNIALPYKATEGSVGYDITAPYEEELIPFESKIIWTGLRIRLPENIELQIRMRSSLALQNIVIPNAPATIDSDFTGEIGIILMNLNKIPVYLHRGDRICQFIPKVCYNISWIAPIGITTTPKPFTFKREEKGFGSSTKQDFNLFKQDKEF